MTEPYLSSFVICGDSGLSTLAAALKSLVFRTAGPVMDELVIGWNGKDEEAFLQALSDGFGVAPTRQFGDSEWHQVSNANPFQLKVVRFDWPGRFDTARNLTMKHCRGEWIYWIDADDQLCDAGTPEGQAAIEAVERAYNIPPPQGVRSTNMTLKDWLKSLPFGVNCILAPYDYAVLQDGSVTIRQTMKRILRRGANWVWRSFSGIHELPYPANSIGEASLFTPGLLNRHFPAVEATDRLKRNAAVIEAMQKPEVVRYADARHHYDVASVHIGSADFAGAEKAISEAIRQCRNDVDLYRYFLIRYSVIATVGRLAEGLSDALKATGIFPERGEAYFATAECYYLMGRYRACIKYYELGAACPVSPVDLDLCINRIVRPRANAAWSYCELGEPEKGLPIALEALQQYPNDALAQKAYNRCAADVMRNRGQQGLKDAMQWLFGQNELGAVDAMLGLADSTLALRGQSRDVQFIALRQQVQKRWNSLGRVTTEALSETTYRRTYPSGHPPIDPASIQLVRQQLLDLTTEADGSRVAILRDTKKPRISFLCHGNSLPWNPTYPETVGVGGSETSFIMLARELSKRGYPVTMYCTAAESAYNIDKGVVWTGLQQFDDTRRNGVIISCRTPWVVRSPTMRDAVYCWHQDNGYANEWSWSKQVEEKLKGNFHVSNWARDGLLRELGGGAPVTVPEVLARQHVIGNPVLQDWCVAMRPRDARPERNPRRVIYASDPMRGLDTLVNVWPMVREVVPDAELHVYSDFTLASLLMGLGSTAEVPIAREMVETLQHKLRTLPGITWVGRVPQPRLSEDMMAAGIYAYPGCNMPEGFGVVLAQAAAAGMTVLAPNEGALPEVLEGAQLFPPLHTEEDAKVFAQLLTNQLQCQHEVKEEWRMKVSTAMWERHGVDKVADRFEAVLKRDGVA